MASVLGELAARAGLAPALGGRDAGGLAPLLGHLARHIADPRHTRLLAGVAHRLLDAYGGVVRRSPAGPAGRLRMRVLGALWAAVPLAAGGPVGAHKHRLCCCVQILTTAACMRVPWEG